MGHADHCGRMSCRVESSSYPGAQGWNFVQTYVDFAMSEWLTTGDAEQEGFSYGTLRRAFGDLHGKSTALGEGVPKMWMWELPEEGGGV